ncbi:MAG: MATE family efflux transporter [Methanolobus sp.]
MVNDHQLRNDSVWSLFCRFTFPAVAGIVVAGIQTIIDGFFIGNSMGSNGLAAITLAFPVMMLIVAIGIMAGAGSSSLVALELGKSNIQKALEVVSNVFSMLLVMGFILTIFGFIFVDSIIGLLGAEGIVATMMHDYLQIVFTGVVFILFALALEPLVRNDGRPVFVMKVMIISVLTNIILDYVFIMRFGMGMRGAAIATMIAFAMIAVILASHLFSSRARLGINPAKIGFHYGTIFQIIKTGLPSFGMQFAIFIFLLVHNFVLLEYGSETAVSAFGIIDYSFSMFYMLFEGIAMGVQPIIGFNYGAGLYGRVRKALIFAIIACFSIGAIGFAIMFSFPEKVVYIFSPHDAELLSVTTEAMRIFMISLLLQGAIIVNATYYQSVNKVLPSLFINLGKVFLFLLPLLFILPARFGLMGIWFATPLADGLMFLIAMAMIFGEMRILREKKLAKLVAREKSKIITPQY